MHYTQAFNIGIKDSLNPYTLSILCIFVLYIGLCGNTRRKVFWNGYFFLQGGVLTYTLLSLNLLDAALGNVGVSLTVYYTNLILGVVYLLLGILHLWDWRTIRFAAEKKLVLPFPRFMQEELDKGKSSGGVIWFFFSTLVGSLAAFLSAGKPPNAEFYVQLSFLYQGNNFETAILMGLIYSFFYFWMITFCWIIFIVLTRLKSFRRDFLKFGSLWKVIAAGITLSIGIGFIWSFIG